MNESPTHRTKTEKSDQTARVAPSTTPKQEVSTLVGIPAYNEGKTIADVVTAATQYVDEVLVVDDGSSDETVARAREADATVVEHEQNRGYGGALQTIFDEAHDREVDHLVILDGDGQHDPRDAARLVEAQRERDAEVVIGSRFVDGAGTDAPLYRRFGLSVINGLTNVGLRLGYGTDAIVDTQSGFRAYDADAIETLSENDELSDGMDASIDILFQSAEAGHSIAEVPIEITYDVEDPSTHHPIRQGVTLMLSILFRLSDERALQIPTIPAAVLIILGVGLATVTLSDSPSVTLVPPGTAAFVLLVGGLMVAVAPIVRRV